MKSTLEKTVVSKIARAKTKAEQAAEEAERKRKEVRYLYTKPCPPDRMHRPNGYWFLRRIAKNFINSEFSLFWDNDDFFEDFVATLKRLRETSKLFPGEPTQTWKDYRLGDVFEIGCPGCGKAFEWEGLFYAPICPHCGGVWIHIHEGKDETGNQEHPDGGAPIPAPSAIPG